MRYLKWTQLFILMGLLSLTVSARAMASSGVDAGTTPTSFDFPRAGTTRIIGQEEVERLLKTHGSDLLIVNFWATTCGPCIAEMPYFVKLSKEYEPKRVRVVGLSVDLKRDVEPKVIPFLLKRKIPYSNLVVFADPTPLVEFFSDDWEGLIPATFFYDRDGNKLGEVLGPLEYEELKELTEKHLPKEQTSLLEVE